MTILDDNLNNSTCGTDNCCGDANDVAHSIASDAVNSKMKRKPDTPWHRIRGGVMFLVACIASPCCTPLIVPLVITLLAGTPVAVWMTYNQGLVYGGLTVLSLVSFVMAFRWLSNGDNGAGFSGIRALVTSFLHRTEKLS